MKNKLKIAAAQFETRDGDKDYNLKKMEDLIGRAAREGADAISFHELCTTGYTFLKNLDRESLMRLAEEIPEGVTTQNLISLAGRYDIVVLAGVLEREGEKMFYSYVAVVGEGVLLRCVEILPFINSYLSLRD